MNTVLPFELEEKRLAIARSNNRRVISLILVLGSIFLITALLLRHLPVNERNVVFFLMAAVAFPSEIYFLRRGLKQNEKLCLDLGFVCPHCRKPLYEPRSFISVNGLCPKCRKSIIA